MSVKLSITKKLTEEFSPLYLEVINESQNHNVPPNSETHFKVVIVSDNFAGKRAVQCHQLVYKALAEEMSSGVHALALHTYTSQEWQSIDEVQQSPDCMG